VLAQAGWADNKPRAYRRGEGCRQCHGSGFRGRSGIYEIMETDEHIRDIVQDRGGEAALRKHLRVRGHLDLRQEGLRLVEQGTSTLEEVLRVTHIETRSAVRAERARTPEVRVSNEDKLAVVS
jgi:general secretion pathway protein E